MQHTTQIVMIYTKKVWCFSKSLGILTPWCTIWILKETVCLLKRSVTVTKLKEPQIRMKISHKIWDLWIARWTLHSSTTSSWNIPAKKAQIQWIYVSPFHFNSLFHDTSLESVIYGFHDLKTFFWFIYIYIFGRGGNLSSLSIPEAQILPLILSQYVIKKWSLSQFFTHVDMMLALNYFKQKLGMCYTIARYCKNKFSVLIQGPNSNRTPANLSTPLS